MKQFLTRILLVILVAAATRAADVSISSLPAIGNVTSTTLLPVVDTSGTYTTKKANAAQLITGLPQVTTSTDGKMIAADKAKLDSATAAATGSTLMYRDSSGNTGVNVLTATQVTGLNPPTNASDAATKSYVDASAAGLNIKTPARAATTLSNISLSGGAPNTLDGVTLALNDRVLVKDQTDAKQNGIYYVSTLGTGSNGTWTRTTDADTGAELVTGSYVFITGGTTNINSAWTMVTPGTITIGTSLITWNLFSQTTQILASNIIGQIVASQVQDGAINTAKFALGLEPVSLVSALPSPSGYTGPKTVFNTSDGKLYRYDGTAFTAAVSTVDLAGQITNTQIQDNSISTPKLQALSIDAGKIATNAVTAGKIAANAVTAGTISAGAVNTNELAAGAVNASKIAAGSITADRLVANTITAGQIAAGTITADRLNISTLSAITANIGTITSGTLTSSISISVGSGSAATVINSSGIKINGGTLDLGGDGTYPWVRMYGVSPYSSALVQMSSGNAGTGPSLSAEDGGVSVRISAIGGIFLGNSKSLTVSSGSTIQGSSGGSINLFGGNAAALSIACGEDGSAGSMQGYIVLQINGRAMKVPFYNM